MPLKVDSERKFFLILFRFYKLKFQGSFSIWMPLLAQCYLDLQPHASKMKEMMMKSGGGHWTQAAVTTLAACPTSVACTTSASGDRFQFSSS